MQRKRKKKHGCPLCELKKKRLMARRRRISGFGGDATSALTTVAAATAGSVVANMIGNSMLTSMTGTMKGLLFLAAGTVLSISVKDNLIKGVGVGIALNGGTTLLGPTGFNVISGIRGARMGRVGRNGRYLGDGVAGAYGRYSVRPGASRHPGQTAVIAGVKKQGAGDFNGNTDYDGNADFK